MKISVTKCLMTVIPFFVFVGTAEASLISPIFPDSNSLVWMDVTDMPVGAKVALLSGNPSKKEPFVARLKMPAGYVVPLHEHPITEDDTVISGTYYLGTGNKINLAKGAALPAGSFVSIPAKTLHYGWTKEETILQVSGVGPWGMIYPEGQGS